MGRENGGELGEFSDERRWEERGCLCGGLIVMGWIFSVLVWEGKWWENLLGEEREEGL